MPCSIVTKWFTTLSHFYKENGKISLGEKINHKHCSMIKKSRCLRALLC